jgi:hypothetical protein
MCQNDALSLLPLLSSTKMYHNVERYSCSNLSVKIRLENHLIHGSRDSISLSGGKQYNAIRIGMQLNKW